MIVVTFCRFLCREFHYVVYCKSKTSHNFLISLSGGAERRTPRHVRCQYLSPSHLLFFFQLITNLNPKLLFCLFFMQEAIFFESKEPSSQNLFLDLF